MRSQSLWLVLYAICLVLLGGGYAAIAAAETTTTQCVSGQCSRAIYRTVTPKAKQYRPLVGRIVPRR
jgi:hypothetical protein